jgi:pyruvate formate lyase activating enzyme
MDAADAKGLIFDIRKYSVHDGPGIRTAVFLKGCPLRCLWCHNPEGLSPMPEILHRPDRCVAGPVGEACGRCAAACLAARGAVGGLDPRREAGSALCATCMAGAAGGAARGAAPCAEACPAEALQLVGRRMSAEQVMAVIREDLPFYEDSFGGATFSGGEPLAQGPFVLELLEACEAEGIHTALDTSGFAPRDLVLEAGLLADLVLFDLKLVDSRRHEEATGVPSEAILDNLQVLAESGARIALRVPLIPGVNDGRADLEAAAKVAARAAAAMARRGGGAMKVHILPYHAAAKGKYSLRGWAYAMGDTAAPSPEAARAAAAIFERAGLAATIGG